MIVKEGKKGYYRKKRKERVKRMKDNKTKGNKMKNGKRIGIFLLIVLLCFGVGVWTGSASRKGRQAEIADDLITNRIEEISQLASLEYHYTRVGKYEDRVDFYGWQVPLTMKRFIISYDGIIWAGVDLKQAKIEVKKDGSVSVTLPEAQILAHEQDLDSIHVFDETKNVFNPIRITDYIEFSKDEKQKAEQEAVDKGLLIQAQERAETVVTEWVTALLSENGTAPAITVISATAGDAQR